MTHATAPATTAELLARVDEGWRHFREGVRHVGRAGLAERTSAGGTYKDLVAHVAAALEEAPRRLVGPEAMPGELDTAHRQLVAAVRGLRDEEVAGSSHDLGVLSIVAWCSYLHFDEHLAEIGVPVR